MHTDGFPGARYVIAACGTGDRCRRIGNGEASLLGVSEAAGVYCAPVC